MPSVTRTCGTGANDASYGTHAWSNPTRITSNDGSLASTTLISGSTNYLKATNFNFSTLIPAGSTITGIAVSWEIDDGNDQICADDRVRIVKGGVIGSTDLGRGAGVNWPTIQTLITFGGDGELWGETWTVSDIESATFGAVISAAKTGGFAAPSCDYCSITVYYTEAAAGQPAAKRMGGVQFANRRVHGGGGIQMWCERFKGWKRRSSGILVPG